MTKQLGTVKTALATVKEVYGINLKNEGLAVNVTTMIKALDAGSMSTWAYAKALSHIMAEKLYSDDFDSSKKFLEAVGVSKGLVSQYGTAVRFMNEHNLDYTLRGMDENKVYAIASSKCDLDKLTDGMALQDYITSHSVADIKAAIKSLKSTVDVEAKEVHTGGLGLDDDKTADNKTADNKTADVVEFDLDGKHYAIPADVLAKYEVKEEES
ncbi:hypothetical protein ACR77U_13075 [Enterococcus faecium]|uniref:hypothetical protein n=1 Tax=Enterococcus faecium TaxID=1352 RepID=UPI003DA51219